MNQSIRRAGRGAAFALAAACALWAVETKLWTQSEASEFEKGTIEGIALSSAGRLTLAPVFRELHDPALPQLWSAAADSKGTLYAGGAEGQVLILAPGGQAKVLATLDGGSVHALALNAKDELFAAVMPGAKIYRIAAGGTATLFAEPKAHYLWAMVFDRTGDLYAAVGDPGQILRINPQGQVSVLFEAEEAHVRSLALLPDGNLVAGTEPGGVVLRVTPKGEGFVLHQTGKREVTAVTAAPDGTIYAAAAGVRGPAAPPIPVPAAPVPQPAQPGQQQPQGQPSPQQQPVPIAGQPVSLSAPPTVSRMAAGVPGGSEIWKIGPDGEPVQIWSHPRALVYTLALDSAQRPVAGTGNEGQIYRIDSATEDTRLVTAEPMQVTALVPGPRGALYAATANPAKLFQLGPELEKEGTIESELLDAGSFTYWGRLRWEGDPRGGVIRVESRSGNLDRAQKNWSPWSEIDAAKGGRIQAPPARFLGWRATLRAAANGDSPELRLVETAYQAKNVAPVIERIEVAPANYRFPGPPSAASTASTLSLGPIGQPRRAAPPKPNVEPAGPVTLTYEKGAVSARWKASDANGDTLRYKVELRGGGEREWKLLRDDLRENRLTFDGARYPDGRYRLRVTASDQVDNYPGAALSATAESEEFLIDNTAPRISGLTARMENKRVVLRFKATDNLSPLMSAEYSVNGGEWQYAQPTTRITDSLEHDYEASVEANAGAETVIAVRVSDENDNTTVERNILQP